MSAKPLLMVSCGVLLFLAACSDPGSPETSQAPVIPAPEAGAPPVSLHLADRRAGTVFRDCENCPEMVRVPTGSFRMGSSSREKGHEVNEGPLHDVSIGYPLAVGRFEITRGQWWSFVQATNYRMSVNGCNVWNDAEGKWGVMPALSWRDAGFAQSDDHPVVCVNWSDAKQYTEWLSRKSGKSYRLLSEAEFEYVIRAGSSKVYPWGKNADDGCAYGNYADLVAQERSHSMDYLNCTDGYANTAPAGSFKPSGFGLYDLSGNVWEWTEDCWNDGYAGAPGNGSVWATGDCIRRVVRGGSWNNHSQDIRAANRFGEKAAYASPNLGFRLARTD